MKLTIHYEQTSPLHVKLAIQAHDSAALNITVIHEAIGGVSSQDMNGIETVLLSNEAQDREGVYIIARYHGAIVASAVLEVDTACIEDGYVLQPRSLYNALIDQCETTRMERGVERAMTNVAVKANVQREVDELLATLKVGDGR